MFKEVTGLEVTARTEETREGGQNGFVHQLPGPDGVADLVFRRGLTESDALFDWLNKTSGRGLRGRGQQGRQEHGGDHRDRPATAPGCGRGS